MRAACGVILLFVLSARAQEERYAALMEEHNRAWLLLSQRNSLQAIAQIQDLIQRESSFGPAYILLVRASRTIRDLAGAERYLNGLLVKDPKNAFAEGALGDLFDERAQAQRSEEHYRRCTELNPRWAYCYEPLVNWTRQDVRLEALSARFDRALVNDPRNAALYFAKAYVQRCAGRRKEAASLYLHGLELARAAGEIETVLALLSHLAQTYQELGDHEPALQYAREELALADRVHDLKQAQLALAQLMGSYRRLGAAQQAEQVQQIAFQRAAASGNLLLEAIVVNAVGVDDRSHGRPQAEASLRRAVELFRRAGDLRTAWEPQLYIGKIHLDRGDPEGAFHELLESLQLAQSCSSAPAAAYSLRALGDAYFQTGDYGRALQYQTQSAELFRKSNLLWQTGTGVSSVAEIYLRLGDYPRALHAYQDALQSARDHKDPSEEERLLSEIGRVYARLGDRTHASQSLQAALRLADRIPQPLFEASIHINLATLDLQRKRTADALSHAEKALRLARQTPRRSLEAEALNAVGTVRLQTGDTTTAESHFRAALAIAEPAGWRDLLRETREHLGEMFERRSQWLEALAEYQAAIAGLESLRSGIGEEQRQARFLQANGRPYERAIGVLRRLHANDPVRGYDRQALEMVERGRARAFLDTLAEARVGVNSWLTAEQRREIGALRAEVSRAYAEANNNGTPETRAKLQVAEQRLEDFQADTRQTNPRYAALTHPQPISAVDAQTLARREGIAEIVFALGEEHSEAWMLTGKRVRMVTLPPRSEIERQVHTYRQAISLRPVNEAALLAHVEQGQALYQTLLGPFGPSLAQEERLLIVPDGALYYLPFEALMPERNQYLVERQTVSYAPSVSVWRDLLLKRPDKDWPKDLLAFGDPVFQPHSYPGKQLALDQIVRGAFESRGLQFPPLPSTREEVQGIAALYPPGKQKVYLGPAATEAAVKREALHAYRQIHFATHAVIDEEVPSRSGIVFAPTTGEDGFLQVPEILALRLNADLVVLSACKTGLGRMMGGEGMVGLTRAVLEAGARRVGVSLWEVNDLATADFMKGVLRADGREDRIGSASAGEAGGAQVQLCCVPPSLFLGRLCAARWRIALLDEAAK